VIGCEDRLQNDLCCVEWGVKLYSNQDYIGSVLLLSLVDRSRPVSLRYVTCTRMVPHHLTWRRQSSFTCVADMPHRRRLRSASTEQLDVPTCRRSTIGGRAFPVAAAKVWNGLPSDVTSASSLSVFKNRLKTYLFHRCYESV